MKRATDPRAGFRWAAAALLTALASTAWDVTEAIAFTSTSSLEAMRNRVRGHVLVPLRGEPHSISELRGDVVVVTFWATWCAPCRKELPALDALHRRIAPRGGRVVAVSIDRERRKVDAFVREHALTLPVYHDGPDRLLRDLDLKYFPFTLVLDRAGEVAFFTHETGPGAMSALEAGVEHLVATAPLGLAERAAP